MAVETRKAHPRCRREQALCDCTSEAAPLMLPGAQPPADRSDQPELSWLMDGFVGW